LSDYQLVRFCAPTLAGIKTGSLFTLHVSDDEDFRKEISDYNRAVCKKGLRMIPLKVCSGYVLIYLYRPDMLDRDLKDPMASQILRNYGYCSESCDRCIVDLIKRLRESDTFPHEIGLFLGYPPSDVDGFIRNPNEGFCEVGYWKVYSDVESARRAFRRYRKCTEEYGRMLDEGRTLEQLVV